MVNSYKKYLKYKLKYMELQKMNGGADPLPIPPIINRADQLIPQALPPVLPPALPPVLPEALPPVLPPAQVSEYDLPVIDETEITEGEGINLLKNIGLNIGYYNYSSEQNKKRINFLRDFLKINKGDAIKIFNEEKKRSIKDLKKLDKLIKKSKIKIEIAKSENFILKNYEGRKGMSIYNYNGKSYILKIETFSLYKDTFSLSDIFLCYDFIQNCLDMKKYFLEYSGPFNIDFVTVLPILMIVKEHDIVSFGYLMEIVPGVTVRRAGYIPKEEIDALIDELTYNHFLIKDFALDNIIWNSDTKTLTYIDICLKNHF
jgi:hypothetical protein